jgi:acetylglutamate kinase
MTSGAETFIGPQTADAEAFRKRSLEELKSRTGQIVVVKFGGNAIMNDEAVNSLIDDVIALVKLGVHIIVVHGGGTAVSEALTASGKKTEKVNGLRVTDSETLEVAVKVFSQLNESVTEKFQQRGASALSFCAKSAIPIYSEKMSPVQTATARVDLGWVGEVVGVEAGLLESWIYSGWIPVISPLGVDASGHFYNINADQVALAVAKGMKVDQLIFLTDVPGVMKDPADISSVIPCLKPSEAESLIKDGTISGGMLPKIKSCLSGLEAGVDRIVILNSFAPYALLKGILAPEEIGTLIVAEGTDVG